MAFTANRVHAVVELPRSVPRILVVVRSILASVAKNSVMFPSPNPPLVELTKNVDALDAAQTATYSRKIGTAQTRDAQRVIMMSSLDVLRAYVQQMADASPADAAAIVTAAGMRARRRNPRMKKLLEARQLEISGAVALIAKAAAKLASYEWQMSLDKATWSNLPPTLKCKTTVSGLKPGALVYFRYRALTKDGLGDYSDVVSLIVV